MSFKQMVQEALGITPEEDKQLNSWRERHEADKAKQRAESVLNQSTTEFGGAAMDMAQRNIEMDYQAQMQAEKMSQLDNAAREDARNRRKDRRSKSSDAYKAAMEAASTREEELAGRESKSDGLERD